jgi:GPH family glycoside/pentoside/hexuronide:cation symporter
MGASLAGLVIGAGVPLLVYEKAERAGVTVTVLNGTRFTLVAGILSVLAIAAYVACYFLTTERVLPGTKSKEAHGTVTDMIKKSVKNRALLSVIVASVVTLFSQLTLQGMANYIYPSYYNNSAALSVSTVLMVVAMFIAAGVARPLSSKIGKAEMSVASGALASVISFLLFLLRPASVWVYVAFGFVSWLGLGVYSMVSWALITDVIDDAEIRYGVREDGSIYALYSFARKLGQAAAAGLTGSLLTAIGYSEATAFDRGVLDGIFNISTVLPAIGFALLSVILWFWYPLHKRKVEENVRILKEKRGK